MIRVLLYSLLVSIAVCVPRMNSEISCEYNIKHPFVYIGKHVGVLEDDTPKVMENGVCNTYIGAPMIYISDLYDLNAVVSIKRLFLNIVSVSVFIEIALLLAGVVGSRLKSSG